MQTFSDLIILTASRTLLGELNGRAGGPAGAGGWHAQRKAAAAAWAALASLRLHCMRRGHRPLLCPLSAAAGREVRENMFKEVADLYHDLDDGMRPISILFPCETCLLPAAPASSCVARPLLQPALFAAVLHS